MPRAPLSLRLVSPEEEVYRGEAVSVVAPAWDGMVGILPGHAPFITLLGHGELTIERPDLGSLRYYVAGGVLKVERDELVILTEYTGTEPPAELPLSSFLHPHHGEATELSFGGDPLV